MVNVTNNTGLSRSLPAEFTAVFGTVQRKEPQSQELFEEETKSGHVMVIDDEAINIKLVRKVLQDEGFYRFSDITDPREALAKIRTSNPDVILLDIMMPHISGLELLEAIRATTHLKHVPVLILTATIDRETKLEALQLGATDFLTKPVDRAELIPRVRNALQMKACHDQVRNYSNQLEQTVKKRTEDIVASRLQVVQCLARTADFHDDETGQHVVRVGRYAGLIGEELGLSSNEAQLLELAAQLHDVGKIGIPDSILRKQDELTPEEIAILQKHCEIGKSVLDRQDDCRWASNGQLSESRKSESDERSTPLLHMAARTALSHHERWDGTGYPMGLAGEDIPLEGRITAVADVFDALSCKRNDKGEFPPGHCFDLLEQGRGTQFDPVVLDAFLRRREDVVKIHVALADSCPPIM